MISRLLELDDRCSRRLRVAERPGALRRLAIFLAHSGDSWFWGAGLAAVWWFGDADWRRWAVWLVLGIAVTAVLAQTLKWLFRRQRPQGEWGALYRKTDPHSFPSGHAARVAMLAVLALALGPAWFAAAVLMWAPLVALARVMMGVHYVSDVLAGIVLGLAVGLLMVQYA